MYHEVRFGVVLGGEVWCCAVGCCEVCCVAVLC